MRIQLCRYERLISVSELPAVLDNPSRVASEAIAGEIDLGPAMTRFEAVLEGLATGEVRSRTALDAAMVEPLHMAMSSMPHRVTCDTRMWQWLCIGPMRRFVVRRWFRDDDAQLDASTASRFLGAPTLNGMSRNALARLYWCGHQLYNEHHRYELAQVVISYQDFYQAIFERKLGNHPEAARACARALKDDSETVRRKVLMRLNHELSTTVLEIMGEEDLLALVSELSEQVREATSS